MYLALQPDAPTQEVSRIGMLTVAEDIFQDVEAETVLLKGEVVRRAFRQMTEEEKKSQPVWRIRQNRFAFAMECDRRRDELYAKLGSICSCPECLGRYL